MTLLCLPWPGAFNLEREMRGWAAFTAYVVDRIGVWS